MTKKHPHPFDQPVSRRDFLRTAGVVAGGLLVPGVRPLTAPVPICRADDRPAVALAQAAGYDRDVIRNAVQTMLDQLGGLGDVVRPGDSVAIKTNLTGGTWSAYGLDYPAIESYITHPEVVRALAESVLDAGAGKLYIVEGVWDGNSFKEWGHTAIAEDLGATLLNLNDSAPYDDFIEQPVGDDWLIYETFTLNPILRDVDVFMSVAKMKCHISAGITLSMKNLIGLTPLQFYMRRGDGNRTALHGESMDEQAVRLPSVIVDLNRARPIDFALIDGIKTVEGGEGPWIGESFQPVAPGVLVAGRNPVATDAVATAAMGFDPMAEGRKQTPFRDCLNHLQIAADSGLGTHDLAEIEIVGAALKDVVLPFRHYNAQSGDEDESETRLPRPYGV